MYYTDAYGVVYNVGIISYGKNCGDPSPSVNTRITSYLTWIQEKTGNNYCYMQNLQIVDVEKKTF